MSRSTHVPNTTHATVIKQQYETHNVWEFENIWTTTLCSCKPFGRCCFACCCPCCMGCKVAKYSGESAIIGCFPCSLSYFRTKLRTARRIKGGCCSDCCASLCFCCACAQTQMANELESQGMWDIPKPAQQKQHRNEHPHQHNDRFNQHNDYN